MRRRAVRLDEDGFAVVITLSLVALMVLVAVVSAALVAVVATHRRVQAAADLSALAGATAARSGADACAAAEDIAAENGMELQECAVDGLVVGVVVTKGLTLGPGSWVLGGRARAGPEQVVAVADVLAGYERSVTVIAEERALAPTFGRSCHPLCRHAVAQHAVQARPSASGPST